MQRRINVHEEFLEMRHEREKDPSEHSDVVDRMFEQIESELSKLPIDQSIPYRTRVETEEPTQRRQTQRISASQTVVEDDNVIDLEEDAPSIPHPPPLHRYPTKEDAARGIISRMSKSEEVMHYREVIDHAMAIQHKALTRIAQLVKEMNNNNRMEED